MKHEWNPKDKQCDKCKQEIKLSAFYYTTACNKELSFCENCMSYLDLDGYVLNFISKKKVIHQTRSSQTMTV